ncbi:MAG: 30S ribosome-binding factor RbfA [Holosporaceae bacterium]|jgi:ribosome-binding factor A|nr:30S ribosome-binding factor RbfA [Holosporaceae bacterium]
MQINRKNTRQSRVAAEIKRIISEFLLHNSIVDDCAVDPSMISITDVLVSPCLQHVKVFAMSLAEVSGPNAEIGEVVSSDDCVSFLERHVAKIRYHVGSAVRLKYIPSFKFFVDNNLKHAEKVEQLLKRISLVS